MPLTDQLLRMKHLIKENFYISKCPKCGADQNKTDTNCKIKNCNARLYKNNIEEGAIKNLAMAGAFALSGLAGNNAQAHTTKDTTINKEITINPNLDKPLSGNPELDHQDLGGKVIQAYKKIHPDFWVKDSNDIKRIQKQMHDYRKLTIQQFKSGKSEFKNHIPGDTIYDNFMSQVEKSRIDGVMGEITSQYVPPEATFQTTIDHVAGDVIDLGINGAKNHSTTVSVNEMKSWCAFVKWMKSMTLREFFLLLKNL